MGMDFHIGNRLAGLKKQHLSGGHMLWIQPLRLVRSIFRVRKWMRSWQDVERPKHKAASVRGARQDRWKKVVGMALLSIVWFLPKHWFTVGRFNLFIFMKGTLGRTQSI